MSEIAVTLIEPGGERRSAQLLDDRLPVRDVVRILVERLHLPRTANYRLSGARERTKSLPPAAALAEAGVRAGDVLRLDVERDAILRKLLDEMYEQAEEWLEEKLIELAEEKLKEIYRLDPQYPDRRGVRARLEAHRGGSPPATFDVTEGTPAGSSSGTGAGSGSGGASTQPPTQPQAQSGAGGCFLVIVIIGGIAIAANWQDVSRWVKDKAARAKDEIARRFDDDRARREKRRQEVQGTITAGAGGVLEIVDHNTVLDYAYRLYLNGRPIGDVRNPPGGTTRYTADFEAGVNVVELRWLDDNGAKDTRLMIRINSGQFEREFSDDGRGERHSFEWVLDGVRK